MHPIFNLFVAFPIVWASVFLFAIVLFRHKVAVYEKPILYSTVALSVVSYILQLSNLAMFVTIFQPLAIVFCFKYLFGFSWSHTAIITLVTYAFSITVEYAVYGIHAVLKNNNLVQRIVEDDFSLSAYIAFIYHFITGIILHYRLGFTFVPSFEQGWRNSPPTCRTIIILACVGFLIIGMTSLNLFLSGSLAFAVYAQLILSGVSIVLMMSYYFQEQREK